MVWIKRAYQMIPERIHSLFKEVPARELVSLIDQLVSSHSKTTE